MDSQIQEVGSGGLDEAARKVDMDSQIQEGGISSDMPDDEIDLLIREFGQGGISADEPEVDTGPPIRGSDQWWASSDVPEACIGPLSHEFGESGDFEPLFAEWRPPADDPEVDFGPRVRKLDEWGISSHMLEEDIELLIREFGMGRVSTDELEVEIGPGIRKFDQLADSVHKPEADIRSLSHEFGESGTSVTQTEVAIVQDECVETTGKPELDTETVIPWANDWWVDADQLQVIPRGTKWWPVPDKETVISENVCATKDMMIPEPVIYEIHNSGTYWTQVDGVIGAPPSQMPATSVLRSVFYYQMDPPLPPSTMIQHLGAEWGYRPRTYTCGTCYCNGELSDHMTSSCPFMALATQFNEMESRGMPPAKKTSSLKPLGGKKKGTGSSSHFEAYFPPVLSPAERTAANLMTRRKLNLIRICNYLDFTKDEKIRKVFEKFGRVTNAYIPIRGGGGNAFVNFVRRADALLAIKKMNGYEFEGLRLRVVWAYLDASRVDV